MSQSRCLFEKLVPKEWRLASTGWGCHIFNDGTGLIIFLEPGEGATGEGALRMQEREGDGGTSLSRRVPSSDLGKRRRGWTEMLASLMV